MKKNILILLASSLLFTACGSSLSLDPTRLIQSGIYAAQALTLSEAEVQNYVHQYVTQLDAQSVVLSESSPYTQRLRRLTQGLDGVNEDALNFKVYKQDEVNAFACADGSVRVYTGIMDTMSDNELLGVLGHEIGHVALKHTYRQMRSAMLTSAAFEGIASASSTAALLTDSQLGAIGQSMLSAQFSKKQETEADDYGYNFLCEAGKNPWAMAMAFEKLQSLEGGSTQSGPVSNLFSTHPDTATRISRMTQRAVQDGYQRPSN